MKHKTPRYLRTGLQIFFFLYAPAAFSAAFGGVKTAFSLIGARQPLTLSPMTQLFLGLVVSVMLFGRFFCGAACAFGSLSDWLYALFARLQKRLGKSLPALPDRVEQRLRYGKYLVLGAVLLLCLAGQQRALGAISPWDAFAMALAMRWQWAGHAAAWALLLLILLGMLSIPRFFCRFLCPLGAIFSLVPQCGLVRITKPRDGCGSCRACSRACPAKLPLGTCDVVHAGDCLSCGKCTTVCPRTNAAYRLMGVWRLPLSGLLLESVLLAALLQLTLLAA